MTLFPVDELMKSADISPCGLYRYKLARAWGAAEMVNFVMLNPSTADAETDDATIIRCMRYARSWGFGGIVVTNLFAWRSTDPDQLRFAADPIGPENDRAIKECASAAGLVVCAWGARGALHNRETVVIEMLRMLPVTPHRLRLTIAGRPSHPLRLPAKLRPIPMI